MTSWNLNLTEQTDTVLRTLAALDTEEPAVMAATLRAVADRLDPPVRHRPVTRGRSGPIDFDDPALRGAVVRVEPWVRRQAGDEPTYAHDADCNTLHDGPDPCPAPDEGGGLGGPAGLAGLGRDVEGFPLPGARVAEAVRNETLRPGRLERTRITPDGCGPEHTFTGSCALAGTLPGKGHDD